MINVYGIPNCDTCKRALKTFSDSDIDFRFHDIRKDGLTPDLIKRWEQALGWESLLNRRSTTWRQLADADKANLDSAKAIRLIGQYPTLMKRPVIESGDTTLVGFAARDIDSIFEQLKLSR